MITDLKMPVMDGMAFMQRAAIADADLPVIMVSAYGEIATAVEAIKSGAYDFIERPLDIDDLLPKVKRALEKRKLVLDNRRLRSELANRSGLATRPRRQFACHASPPRRDHECRLHRCYGLDPWPDRYWQGSCGARPHDCSPRSKNRFVAINCGALSESLIDSELFGHEAGAFTDAKQRRIGVIEYAKGGTLLLDEIESMPVALQVKLLRMLQERTISRLGSNEQIKVDIRLVAADQDRPA